MSSIPDLLTRRIYIDIEPLHRYPTAATVAEYSIPPPAMASPLEPVLAATNAFLFPLLDAESECMPRSSESGADIKTEDVYLVSITSSTDQTLSHTVTLRSEDKTIDERGSCRETGHHGVDSRCRRFK